jgi:hypothetical protein
MFHETHTPAPALPIAAKAAKRDDFWTDGPQIHRGTRHPLYRRGCHTTKSSEAHS